MTNEHNEKFDVNKQDWLAFQKFFIEKTGTVKRTKHIAVLFGILGTIFIITICYITKSVNFFDYILIVSFILLTIWFYFFGESRLINSHLEKIEGILNNGENRNLIGKQEIRFQNKKMVVKDPSGEAKINWSSIVKITETEKHIFLFISTMSAYIIPKKKLKNKKKTIEILKSKVKNWKN